MSEHLNFDPDALVAFDAAGDPADALAAFDAATGATAIPPGHYLCRVGAGALVSTKAGKPAYRLRFAVVEPAEHAGFVLWRYYVLFPNDAANWAKAALAPLGLRSAADLRRPFPDPGRAVLCRVVVGVQARPDRSTGNDVVRFAVAFDNPAAPNPFAVPLDPAEGGANP